MVKFSQNEEEKYILEYFGDFVGSFLDIGSNDGITFSNTRQLALNGWTGVCIDANREASERCEKLYKGHSGIYVYHWAIAQRFANGKKYILNGSGNLINSNDVGLVSTFYESEMERFKKTVWYKPESVIGWKWKTAYNRLRIRQFSFVSIHVESDEMQILPYIDLTETRLICLEHNGSIDRKNEYLKHTAKYDLTKVIYESAENIIICKS